MEFDLSGFPSLLAFQKRVAERPAVQAALEAEGLAKKALARWLCSSFRPSPE